MGIIPNRDQALAIFQQYNDSEALMRHALAVEGVMRHFAGLFHDPDENLWGVVGLLHDIDYGRYPEQHCQKAIEILHDHDIDESIIRAVISHGFGICSDVQPQSDLEKVLYTIDELTGLIHAAALMRPSKSVLDMELKSLKNKFKTVSFAAGVNRAVVQNGSEMLGMDLDSVLSETLLGIRKIAPELGLDGSMV
jgi:putative nucleotidyltransferase with HDIG domain